MSPLSDMFESASPIDTDAVWRALGDPTRRAILDSLRPGPQNTGTLCAAFPSLGRTTVMKHLGVLVDAGLVLIRRRGRHRFNHLNPVPLEAIHERWIAPHVGHRAKVMLALARAAEAESTGDHTPSLETQMPETPTTEQIELALKIIAERRTVWRTMIRDIGRWWPADYRGTEPAGTFHFEAWPGGRIWEETATGGLQWYSVQALEAEQWVSLAGFIAPPWGGPSVSLLRIELRSTDAGETELRVTDSGLGRLPDRETVETGWRTIFGGLKRHIEQPTDGDR